MPTRSDVHVLTWELTQLINEKDKAIDNYVQMKKDYGNLQDEYFQLKIKYNEMEFKLTKIEEKLHIKAVLIGVFGAGVLVIFLFDV